MYTLVLVTYIIMDVPDNLKYLLEYKQEEVSHARWITTANGYLRAVIFRAGMITPNQQTRPIKMVSYILSVHVPFFLFVLGVKLNLS